MPWMTSGGCSLLAGQEALNQMLSEWDRSSKNAEAPVCSVQIVAVRSAADSDYKVHGPGRGATLIGVFLV